MKKYILDLSVRENIRLSEKNALLKVSGAAPLPEMAPGQFAQLKVEGSPSVFLRRPISINFVDRERNEIWFLIQIVGEGTRCLAQSLPGTLINVIFPLGKGFTMPEETSAKVLLIGGGVGIAPLLFLGEQLAGKGIRPVFLLGAKSRGDLFETDNFATYGDVHMATEDGSAGERGFVTQHSLLKERDFDRIYTCGPKPMMVAVANYAKARGIFCEVSLENVMACGIGACLCCVENTSEGHQCVCTEGPVFNITKLLW